MTQTNKLSLFLSAIVLFIFVVPGPVRADFSFGAAGDIGGSISSSDPYNNGYADLHKKIGQLGNPANANPLNFFILLGDISYGDNPSGYTNNESGWCQGVKDYINIGAGKAKGDAFGEQFAYEMVAGNHDDDYSGGLIDRFTRSGCLPNRMPNMVLSTVSYTGGTFEGYQTNDYGKEYYFDYPTTGTSLARFIQISPALSFTNGGSYSYSSTSSARYIWLQNTIDAARTAGIPWVIVSMHENCITSATKSCSISTTLMSLLLSKNSQGKQRVDLILQGHDHTYQRSKQLSVGTGCTSIATNTTDTDCIVASGSTFSKGNGTVLVINGAGGNTVYTVNSGDSENGYFESWMGSTAGSESKPPGGNGYYGLATFKVTASQLSSQYYAVGGGTFTDSFTINAGPTPTPGSATPTPTSTPTRTPTSTPTNMPSPTRTPTPVPTSTIPTPTGTTGTTKDVFFQPTTEDFLNPERGFYKDVTISGSSSYTSVRSNGSSLVHAYVRLDSYRTSAIPQSFLDDLNSGFAKLRQAKIKTIVRMTYNFDMSSPDASESIINQHIAQLKPIFENNQDVIYYIQAGFVGAWGEWHTSTNFTAGIDGNGADFTTLGRVYRTILTMVPTTRMSALRYSAFRKGIFNNAEISPSTAFDGSDLSRTGFHNDCFLASTNDEGTYNLTGQTVQQVKDYIGRQSLYTPMTGETCVAPARVSCTAALSELESMHWSALNNDFDTSALDILRTQGCYNEIHRRLGYRFSLQKVTVPTRVNPGGQMSFYMEVKNEGYAPMYNDRPVYLVFENTTTGVKTPVRITAADPRRWLPAAVQATNIVNTTMTVPSNLATGMYKIYMWLPDAAASLQTIPEYAVQLANASVWQAATGYNYVTDAIEVTTTGGQKTGDTNNDTFVNLTDLATLLSNFGKSNLSWNNGDFNGDHLVNLSDLSALLSNFGR